MKIASLANSLEQLDRKKKISLDLDTEIANAIDRPEDLETEILESEDIQCHLMEKRSHIRKFLELHQNPPSNPPALLTQGNLLPHQPSRQSAALNSVEPPTHSNSAENSGGSTEPETSSTEQVSVPRPSVSRLPKLSLPSFSGDPLVWQIF